MSAELSGYRISPQQRRLWRLSRSGVSLAVQRELHVPAGTAARTVREAVEDALSRHRIFRTLLRRPAGMKVPLQVLVDQPVMAWRELESAGTGDPPEPDVQRLRREELARPFDLAEGPLVRAVQWRPEDDEHALLLTLSAAVVDAPSLEVLLSEIEDRLLGGGAAGPDEAPVQYAQYSEWQRQVETEVANQGAGAPGWKEALLEPSVRRPPFVRPSRPGGGDGVAAPRVLRTELGPELVRSLEAVAGAQGVPLATVLHAAWKTLLSRLSGHSRPVTALALAARPEQELNTLVGPLSHYVPVATRLDRDLTFGESVTRVARSEARAAERQMISAWDGDERLEAAGSLPFGFEVEGGIGSGASGKAAVRVAHRFTRRDDLIFELRPVIAPGSVALDLYSRADRVGAEDAERLGAQLERLVERVAEEPSTEIGAIDLLPAADRRRLLIEIGGGGRGPEALPESDRPVHEQIADVARRTPQAVAVETRKGVLSYGDLDGRANRLARRLEKLGVGPEVPVGLTAERSLGTLVGLLGILKAGGAYVPLDLVLPVRRLSLMVETSGLDVLVTDTRIPSELSSRVGHVVHLVDDRELLEREEAAPGPAHAGPENLAYVIFTSGSTGEPKGVAVEHRQLTSYLRGIADRLELEPGESYATVSTLAADLGNTMLFPALVSGGTLHVVPPEALVDSEAFAAYLSEREVDNLKIVPSHLEALLGSHDPVALSPRRRLVLGGEAAGSRLLELLCEGLAEGCRLFNHYGPTETTVGVTCGRLDPGVEGTAGVRPLGSPLAGTRVVLAGPDLRPAPLGAPAEIVLGGGNVARGYHGRPGTTAASFVPDPFGERPGARLYRSGDLARWWSDGTLEFLGRIDDQLKVRGYRIEPGEVAAAIEEHPSVRETVVVGRRPEGAPGGTELVAYYTLLDGGPDGLPDGLRSWVQEQLPSYMVPSAFVALEALPLTANGKVDFAALPSPEGAGARRRVEHVSPRGPLDEVLAGLWREVLRLDRVGIDDDFFEVGGHSLLATQLLSRLRQTFSLELPMRALFDAPTIRELAVALEQHEEMPGQVAKVAWAIRKVESMSEAEVEALLEAKRDERGGITQDG